jgi:nucleotidyltransferase/DNA polymerase involved in DNA repair
LPPFALREKGLGVEGKRPQCEKPPPETPLILTNDKGLVAAASLPALRAGVARGMRLRAACSLCPDAQVKGLDDAPYREFASALEELFTSLTTLVEAVPPFWNRRAQAHPLLPIASAAWVLDIGKHLPRDAESIVRGLGEACRAQLGVVPRFGLAAGKFPALVAAKRASEGQPILVRRGEEGDFIAGAGLPISCLPLSRDALRQLQFLGMATLRDIAALPVSALTTLDSKMGRLAHRLARGDDPRPVVPRKVERTEAIRRTFDGGIDSSLILDAVLLQMATELAERLHSETLRALRLKVSPERGRAIVLRRTLREPTARPEVIGRHLLRLRNGMDITAPIAALEVEARDIALLQWQQLDLFGTPPLETHSLRDLIETLSDRFGTEELYEVVEREPAHLVIDRRYSVVEVTVA